MLFTSLSFFILLTLTFCLYYVLKNIIAQVLLLLVASFTFYAWNYPILLTLLVGSIAINVLSSYGVHKSRNSVSQLAFATVGVLANLAILAFFKYSPLVGQTFWGEGTNIGDFLISIPLPIGISFFTFQGISLVVDIYRGDVKEEGKLSFFQFALQRSLFIAFFPQLVAGPIVKAKEFLPQIEVKFFKDIQWETCFKALVTGYFLKTVVADNLMDQTAWMDFPYYQESSVLHLLSMLFGYSIQIFADFAGYSLIAIGVAGLFGYYLKDNFNFPYISTSFAEFWRRWHISLSSFLKEYLYIPLGGNRKGKIRTYLNLMITMILGGFWHGAAWSYAIWGFYHGVLLAVERVFRDLLSSKFPPPIGQSFSSPKKAMRLLRGKSAVSGRWIIKAVVKGVGVFGLVTLGWLLFRLPDFTHVVGFLGQLTKASLIPSKPEVFKILYIFIFALPVVIYHFLYLSKANLKPTFFQKWNPLFYGLMLFLIATNRGTAGAFIYFQF